MITKDRESETGTDVGKPSRPWRGLLGPLVVTLLLLWAWFGVARLPDRRSLSYSEFKAHVARREVLECTIRPDDIEGRLSSPPAPAAAREARAAESPAFVTVRVDDPGLVGELQAAGVKYQGERPSGLGLLLWAWLLPIGLILLIALPWLRLGAARAAALDFGKSRAKLIAERSTGVCFDDVAGCDEAKQELQEVVDFLRDSDRYQALGARIPKGVLLTGPPGTGKTLLARAVAGEAGVPFFCLSGSEFVEMFVGVGAARVRDLFAQAKAQVPCIVFIDELDAIGRQRSVHITTAGDEREQTLNQLLVELDGFAPNSGVIVLSATNRPDVLDRALLRPGRFDRQVVIDAPDLDGREAILKIHARDKPMADDADLRELARETPGFSGADLANVMNEAALLAARRRVAQIGHRELEEAMEKVVAGPERRSRRLSEDLKRRVSYHEAGHALVAAHSPHSDPVRKISIVPRGRAALGYTLQLPAGDQLLMTREELVDRIRALLGGRAAEELVLGGVSTGAEDDLERATALARQMICRYGMGRSAGLAHVGTRPEALPLGTPEALGPPDCSEQTAREIDEEVKGLLAEAYATARDVLASLRDRLDRVAGELLRRETLEGEVLQALLGGAGPSPAADGPPAGATRPGRPVGGPIAAGSPPPAEASGAGTDAERAGCMKIR